MPTRTRPKTAVRRLRKRQLAARDGWRCVYCRRRFRSLAEATLDHVVPYRLLRTWSVGALVLACRDCNHRKGDRFPLLLALLLAARYHPVHGRPAVFTDDRSAVHDEPTALTRNAPAVHGGQSSVHEPGGMFTATPEAFTPPLTLATWRLLTRLAHAQRSTPDHGRQPREHPTKHAANRPESTPTGGTA
ncbi:HNH endonuclease [Streptomyces misionensis]|uniref:HNH endonuclease n=1 Tax=Streptomyces misionensis TaxID=67331 RepID=A0A5C6JWI4_9ACTN|nr:HNH endonuclease [Streptomyces misionensis]TWV50245.1 HNH endonuclease [Streptomyces misionensis]